jgi:sugar phosphate isomerase/epimerase
MKNIKRILIAMAVVFICTTACQRKEVLVSDPGVVSYSFRDQFADDIPGTLDLIKNMGISNIEFSNLFGSSAKQIRKMLDERAMVCTAYGVSYDALNNNIKQVVNDAKELGANYVRVAWIPHEGDFTINDAERAVKDFNNFGKILSENELFFCYHNHGYEFSPYKAGTLFDYIVQNTHPDYVSFELDLLWTVHPGADPVELLHSYPERFRLMHLKDLKKGVKGDFSGSTSRDNDVVLGTGKVDFPVVLRAAQYTNIKHYYIEDESPDVENRIPVSREYIMKIKD